MITPLVLISVAHTVACLAIFDWMTSLRLGGMLAISLIVLAKVTHAERLPEAFRWFSEHKLDGGLVVALTVAFVGMGVFMLDASFLSAVLNGITAFFWFWAFAAGGRVVKHWLRSRRSPARGRAGE